MHGREADRFMAAFCPVQRVLVCTLSKRGDQRFALVSVRGRLSCLSCYSPLFQALKQGISAREDTIARRPNHNPLIAGRSSALSCVNPVFESDEPWFVDGFWARNQRVSAFISGSPTSRCTSRYGCERLALQHDPRQRRENRQKSQQPAFVRPELVHGGFFSFPTTYRIAIRYNPAKKEGAKP